MNPMTENEFLELRQSSNWDLRELMERNRKELGLDRYTEFAWHPWRGELVWASGGVPKVVARVQVAGMLSTRNKSWTWGWALTGLPAPVRQDVLKVRQLGEERAVLSLMQPKWAAGEQDAWHMTAIACKLLDGKGAFKCPAPDGATFLVLTDLRPVSDRKRVLGASVCIHVVDEGRPVLLVAKELDGETLAVCGAEDDSTSPMLSLTLDQLLALDDAIAALADLPDGWVALRESADHDWTRSKSE